MARFLLYSLAVFLVTSPALALDTPVGLNSITQNGRRKLNQGKGPAVKLQKTTIPEYFGLNKSEGISEISAWCTNPPLSFVCGNNVTVNPANPDLCVDRVEVIMVSSLAGNTTVTFDAEQLDELKSVKVEDNVYVYGLPLSKVAPPNTLYEATEILTVFSDGNETVFMRPSIYNYFNASAASLREYYGVNPGLQGTEDQVQASTLSFGLTDSAVNTTAVEEYLILQGLVPNIPLQLTDWAPKNNVSICLPEGDGECTETMLDVQTQQAFVPQAVTHFTPTKQPISVAVAYLEEFLKGKGYASEAIEETVEAVEAGTTDKLPASIKQDIKVAYSQLSTEYFLEFIKNVTTSEERAQVVSLSWNSDYAVEPKLREEALKNLTLSGVSILVSSGDSGASGLADLTEKETCLPKDNPLYANQQVLQSVWPNNSPWVTVVGGTQMLATEEYPEGTEVVASSLTDGGITSGGGFTGTEYPSSLYSMPVWQKKFAERYLSENNASTFDGFPTKDTPGFNPNGRAFPDIAMYAAYFPILSAANGDLSLQAGTSLAAPMAAAIFTLVNQKLLADGYKTIGYANPMIYWMGENCTDAFHDISVGNNQGDKQFGNKCLYGFPAAPGWDPATGFGSIKFDPFVACAKRYQDEVRSKGLEILPDGSLNTAAGYANGSPPSPSSSAVDLRCMSSGVAACIAILAALS